jgi:hypothetical protein
MMSDDVDDVDGPVYRQQSGASPRDILIRLALSNDRPVLFPVVGVAGAHCILRTQVYILAS